MSGPSGMCNSCMVTQDGVFLHALGLQLQLGLGLKSIDVASGLDDQHVAGLWRLQDAVLQSLPLSCRLAFAIDIVQVGKVKSGGAEQRNSCHCCQGDLIYAETSTVIPAMGSTYEGVSGYYSYCLASQRLQTKQALLHIVSVLVGE